MNNFSKRKGFHLNTANKKGQDVSRFGDARCNVPNVHVPLFVILQLSLLIRSGSPMVVALMPSQKGLGIK